MTQAQKKANELVGKMFKSLKIKIDQNRLDEAKQCSLICVNEILEELGEEYLPRAYKFWEEVKKEIEKL